MIAAVTRTLLAVALSGLAMMPAEARAAEPTPGEPGPTPARRGFALPTYQADGYEAASGSTLRDLAAAGGTWVQLNPTWYQTSPTASRFGPGPDSATDAGVRRLIRLADRAGLRVSLKPHIDLPRGGDRAGIVPADRDAWFANYRAFITHYARIAAQEHVDEFAVGTELAGVSADRERWLPVIAAVREAYPGPLTYAANYDEFERVAFWGLLDLIGVDAYFPLAAAPTTDLAELMRAWAPIRDRLARTAERYGRPVLFTEAGYRSQVGATTEPFAFDRIGPADQREQAMAYAALLRTFTGEPWWAGVHWWFWAELPGDEPPDDELSYSPGGKLAEDVLRAYWGS
jgi:hypothetical protein